MDSRLKLTIPAHEIEAGAWEQIKNVLSLDCLKTLAIMPDVHAGYDLCIGGVALLDGYISPSFVGYDIGCGMCSVIIPKHEMPCEVTSEYLHCVRAAIAEAIPVGTARRESPVKQPDPLVSRGLPKDVLDSVNSKAPNQLGTLGGGNHFIEVGESEQHYAVTIHSGSRRSGWEIGNWYMKQGRMFPLDSLLGSAYRHDMEWAQEYALANRALMMDLVLSAMGFGPNHVDFLLAYMINENHNHAVVNPDGTVLHRKGATPAGKGQAGIIPANMRDGVYITKGLGNEEFLSSASHGCGRTMSRAKAKGIVTPEMLAEQMDGIVCSLSDSMRDESPSAYKDPNYVINAQNGILVDVVFHFKPLLVVKG